MKLIKNTPKIWIKKFPWKKKSSNKYSRGRVLILGGQKHMIGATILAAEACLRVGVGSVKIICTKETIKTLSLKFPSVLKVEINNISYLKSFLKKERKTTSVALVGPGAGSNSKTMKFTEEILKQIKYVILDADALNSFQHKTTKLLRYLDKFKLITPHKKEFHRLFPSIKTSLEDEEKIFKFIKYSMLTFPNTKGIFKNESLTSFIGISLPFEAIINLLFSRLVIAKKSALLILTLIELGYIF